MITDTKARNCKPNSPQIAHGGVTGLVLIPGSTKGTGKWVLRYVSPVTGKRRNAGLGSYPEVGIAEAGKIGSTMRETITAGQDPLEQKKLANSPVTIPTFEEAAMIVHAELLPGWKNIKHGQQWINTITEYAFPIIGSLTVDKVMPKDIADVLRPIWLSKAETASRLKQRLHSVMNWGWAHGHCVSNPVDVVQHLLPTQPGKAIRTQHQPAMPWCEIPDFFECHFSQDSHASLTRRVLEVLILTAARSGEVRGMQWSEISLQTAIWSIPAERMKAKQIHRIPLTPRVLEILKLQHEGKNSDDSLVFPSVRDRVQLSDMALTSFLRKIKAPSDTQERVATAHGFRSSFRDWCSENNYPRDWAERALAHTVANKVEAAYHRTDLLEQRRPMMQEWEKFCRSKIRSTTTEPGSLGEMMANLNVHFSKKHV